MGGQREVHPGFVFKIIGCGNSYYSTFTEYREQLGIEEGALCQILTPGGASSSWNRRGIHIFTEI
jgi:hypothetical protein